MKLNISKKKIIAILIIIIVLIYLSFPLKVNIDINNTESITVNLTESSSKETISYNRKISDYETMNQVAEILNNISYKKISYLFDISALGNTGYNIEIIDKSGDINIIKIYFDDTARIQSNVRYKLKKGVSMKIYNELLAILKAK